MKRTATVFAFLLLIPGLLSAQAELPSAGITPGSNFYFLDKLGEALQEFFTFNPEAKARLQITFAGERIAEIKVILESKGVDALGLTVAQDRLQSHLAKVAAILEGGKIDDGHMAELAQEVTEGLDEKKGALAEIYSKQERVLEARMEELRKRIREAREAKNDALVDTLTSELQDTKAQKALLESVEKEQEEEMEQEEERIEEKLEDKVEAEKAIREAEEKKQEILAEAKKEGTTIPANSLKQYDQLLAQAKELMTRENYQGAEQLAKQAKKDIDKAAESLEDADEANEDQEDLKEEAEKNDEGAREEEKKLMEEREEAEKKLLEEQKDLKEDD